MCTCVHGNRYHVFRSAASRLESLVARFFGASSARVASPPLGENRGGGGGWLSEYDRIVRFLEGAAPRTVRSGAPSLLDKLRAARGKLSSMVARSDHDSDGATAAAMAVIAPVLDGLRVLDATMTSDSSLCAEVINSGEALFCTLTSAGQSVMMRACRERRVDLLVVDEAGQALEPELLIALGCRPRALVLVGDPKQLPALVQSHVAKRLGYGRSMMERLIDGCGAPSHLLDVQCVNSFSFKNYA